MSNQPNQTCDEPLDDPVEICLHLFDGHRVLVRNWHSGSSLRRAVYRRRKEIEQLYKRAITITARQSATAPGMTELIPDLTEMSEGGKLQRRIRRAGFGW